MYKKIKNSFFWTFLGNLIKGGSGILLLSILSKELGPEKIGLIGILSVIYGLCETLLDFGISQSIISKKSIKKNELSSIFWLNQSFGLILAVITYFLANPISNFIGHVEISNMIRVLSVVFIIEPLDLVFQTILQKNMNFKVLELVTITKQISILISTVFFLKLELGILSYVYGIIFGAIVDSSFLFKIFIENKWWTPTKYFKFSECKRHLKFGVYATLKSFLNFAGANLDQIIIAKIFSVEVLGLYYFSKKIIEQPISFFTSSFTKISFPIYSRMKNNSDIRKTYKLLTNKISLLGFPALSAIFVLSPYILEIIFGKKWLESIELIRLFVVVGAIQLISVGFSSSVILSKNKPKDLFLTDLFFTPVRLFLIFLSSLHSIKSAIFSYILITTLKSVYLQSKTNKMISMSFKEYLLQLKEPIAISLTYVFSNRLISNSYLLVTTTFLMFSAVLYIFFKSNTKQILNELNVRKE